MRTLKIVLLSLFLTSCLSNKPRDINNICAIFQENPQWYTIAKATEAKWGIPVSVQMAIFHQESAFDAHARPRRKKMFGVIPGARQSSAYGYAQALLATWKDYQSSAGNRTARRSNFADASDFLGWYAAESYRRYGFRKNDAYSLYLTYHEGWGGYGRGTHNAKPWLINVAKRVDERASQFEQQLRSCR